MVIAPTTLVTALAFYFGWVFTNARASYFGIDVSALGFSTQDYVLRSADVLFVPLGTIVLLALAAVSLHSWVLARLADPAARARIAIAARAAIVVGAALFVLGLVGLFRSQTFSARSLIPSASPGIGVALMTYAAHLLARTHRIGRPGDGTVAARRPNATSLVLVMLLVVLSGFWTAARYAATLGHGRAERTAATLSSLPHVTVYAPKRLSISAGGVVEQPLSGTDPAYRFRYTGLRLLIRSADRYFLLPDDWARGASVAIVLRDSPDYRFEFTEDDRGRATAPGSAAAQQASAARPGAPVGGSNQENFGPNALAPAPLSFEDVRVGHQSRPQRFSIDADGKPRMIIAISIVGKSRAAFRLARGGCKPGHTIKAHASCAGRVTFAPRSKRDHFADLKITTRPGGSEKQGLNGTGK